VAACSAARGSSWESCLPAPPPAPSFAQPDPRGPVGTPQGSSLPVAPPPSCQHRAADPGLPLPRHVQEVCFFGMGQPRVGSGGEGCCKEQPYGRHIEWGTSRAYCHASQSGKGGLAALATTRLAATSQVERHVHGGALQAQVSDISKQPADKAPHTAGATCARRNGLQCNALAKTLRVAPQTAW
jgi:hypothetical protein